MNGAYEILVVEDNPADVRLVREALASGAAPKRIHVAEDGVEASEFLQAAERLPDLILLDLNLPRRNGRELLAEIRQVNRLRLIPVIVFSSSSAGGDIRAAYEAAANCYVTKPNDLDRYFAAVQSIEQFWLATARLPESTNRNTTCNPQ